MARHRMYHPSHGILGLIWDYCTSAGWRSYYISYVGSAVLMSRYRSGDFIYKLKATFAGDISREQPTNPIKSVVKYEKQFDTEPDPKRPVALSKFAL